MFTLYRVEADYVPQRADIAGPGWVCHTRTQAEYMANRMRRRTDLTNVTIREHTYGYHD